MGTQVKNKCLIVDDEKYFTMYLKILLEKSGFEVTDCFNAKDALEVLKNESFEFILCDIQMPVMDGFDFLYEIKKEDKTKQIPVVFVSNMDDHKYIEKAFKLGASGYIKKPFLKHHVFKVLDLIKIKS